MKNISHLKVVAASLCLSSFLLTGCKKEDAITLGTKENKYKVVYEDDTITATIPLSKINDSIKILKLESQDTSYYQLVGKWSSSSSTYYYDLKTGKPLVFIDHNDNPIILADEYSIIPYLESTDNMWLLFDVNDIISFYEEVVLPDLENKGSEKVYEKEN